MHCHCETSRHGQHRNCGHETKEHRFFRRFTTRSERIEQLKKYRDDLTKELAGVDETLGSLTAD